LKKEKKTAIHGQIVDAVSISERPASVEDRAVPGHWEGDLFFGSGNSQIATLVERQTRYVMLVKLEGKDSQTVVNALIKNARKLPQELYKSLTWLLRQYMPKGIDISSYSQTQLNAIARH
jgi:IS30 family transposase